ncbi:hypothetical protein [Lysobacter gummosus]|uniref:hypothetical protein n=1 Tax=Lysobacter gummosus TaxID=262324 RepID=UPI003626CD62
MGEAVRANRFAVARLMRGRALATIAVALAVAAGVYGFGLIQGRSPDAPAAASPSASPAASQAAAVPGKAARKAAADAAANSPKLTVSLKSAFADLRTRAAAGDIAAATRLYRDLSLCRRFERLDRDNAQLSDDLLGQTVASMSAQQLKNYRAQLDAIESRKQALDGMRALCDGADQEMLDQLLPNLQRAALAGEPYARACYLERGPNYDPGSLLDHPERLGSYRRDVQAMIQAGVEDGDWRVIGVLRNAYQPGASTLLSAAVGTDAYSRYRYLKLFRLGMPSDHGEIDRDLQAAAGRLSAAQLAQADVWAARTFDHDFQGKPIDADGPLWDPCVFPYE